MEIIRDNKWTVFYADANKTFSEEYKVKQANACWRAYMRQQSIKIQKKNRSMKVLTEVPKQVIAMKESVRAKTCQSETMSGKPCKFKAVSECGRYCKKHSMSYSIKECPIPKLSAQLSLL